jgi:hypothetical protein
MLLSRRPAHAFLELQLWMKLFQKHKKVLQYQQHMTCQEVIGVNTSRVIKAASSHLQLT